MIPALSRAAVDRAAHRRADPQWLAAAWETASVLVLDADGRTLVADGSTGPRLLLLAADQVPEGERLFLGEDSTGAYFAVRAATTGSASAEATQPETAEATQSETAEATRSETAEATRSETAEATRSETAEATRSETWFAQQGTARLVGLRDIGSELDARDAGLFVAAVALANWHDAHRFSPRTGAPVRVRDGGWVREAEDGSGQLWPRTDPAVIMLVSDGLPGPAGKALLGRASTWPAGRYSTLAGFVEPGESAEMAVAREVAEEAGVRVTDIRYVASQPWPFPGSLMLGFTALADPAEPVVVDRTELEDVRWFTREELRESSASPPLLPMPTSIAWHLITDWLGED